MIIQNSQVNHVEYTLIIKQVSFKLFYRNQIEYLFYFSILISNKELNLFLSISSFFISILICYLLRVKKYFIMRASFLEIYVGVCYWVFGEGFSLDRHWIGHNYWVIYDY
jgi:hypothetical protein